MLAGKLVVVCVLGILFGALERLRPSLKEFRKPWRELRTDLSFLFLVPPVNETARRLAIVLVVVLVARALGNGDVESLVREGRGPVGAWPAAAQVLAALFAADFGHYWMHRLFHGRRLWRFHAVHHGSEHLNWISAARVHPVNEILQGTAVGLFVLALGFPAKVLAAYVPILLLFGLFQHSNTDFGWRGPMRYLIASPLYHRWHHTSQGEGLDRNFAGLFPLIDLAFGTFHLPEGRKPERFGVAGAPLPPGFWAQIFYPFRSGPRAASRAFAVGALEGSREP